MPATHEECRFGEVRVLAFHAESENKIRVPRLRFQPQPDHRPRSSRANIVRTQFADVAQADAAHLHNVADRSELHFMRTRLLAQPLQLRDDVLAPAYARLRAASDDLLDGVQRGMIGSPATGQIERLSCSRILQWQHLPCFQDRQWDLRKWWDDPSLE